MKQHILFWILLSFSQGLLHAQPIITSDVFPTIGDTLTYAVANAPDNLQITAAGEGQVWDYRSLQADFFVQQTYETPDSGVGAALFPQATLLSQAAQGLESYWRVSENQVELLGAYGQDPLELGIVFSTPFSPPLTEISTPLNYLDTLESNSSFLFAFATEDLPDTIVALLPIAPDSFRVRTNINRLDVVDAWGSLQLPEGNYEVLRQKRLETAMIRIDAKIVFLGWQDVTDVISPLLMGTEFQQDSLLTYRFWSNEARDPVLLCNVDSTGQNIISAQYRNSLLTTNASDEAPPLVNLSVFPNPADDFIQINIQGVPVGQYQIQFFQNNGALAKEERFWVSGNSMTYSLPVSDLHPGFFIGILKNMNSGKTMGRPVVLIKR
jgi:hypothetical protein